MRVKVSKIEGVEHPVLGIGKQIYFTQKIGTIKNPIRGQTEEARLVSDIMVQVQQVMPQMLPMMSQPQALKIMLFLTEDEYEDLGVNFEVNQEYEVSLSNGKLEFKLL